MSDQSEGRLADNILLFCRTLRSAGIAVGTGQVIDAVIAVGRAGILRRDDFYYALRAVLVSDPSEFRIFNQAFHVYFRNPRLLERMMSLLLPTLLRDADGQGGDAAVRRLLEAMGGDAHQEEDDTAIDIDQSGSSSKRELLRHRDFEQMSLEEQREARELLRQEVEPVKQIVTRRFRQDLHGNRYDMRRSMQRMLRNNGQIVQLDRKTRRRRPPTLVVICDISGSMSHYTRMFLYFAHALSSRQQKVHTFVFGTRLTNISRRLADRDIDSAMARISADVKDWDGGTRIADCLQQFNVDWSRRVLAQDAVVVLLSDGLERDSESSLEMQMQRLQRSCRQLIWLNPMLRYDRFEAKASGIRRMLPYVDLFIPAHNINSLGDLVSRLAGMSAGNAHRRMVA